MDTTVTDARLIHRAIEKLVELVKREDVELRQGYLRPRGHAVYNGGCSNA